MEPGEKFPIHESKTTINLDSVVKEKNLDTSMTFKLDNERDGNNELISGEACWIKLCFEGQIAEGKLFIPEGGKQEKLLIFEPGMPGDAVGWMEDKFASLLLENGYTILVLRHLGTRTEGEKSQDYINCEERSKKSKDSDFATIGNGKYNVEEASHEVGVAVNSLGEQFGEITMIAHSSGVLNTMYDFKNIDPLIQEKVCQIIALSGFLDKDEITSSLREESGGLKGYYNYCQKYLEIGSPEENVEAAKKMLDDIKQRGKDVLTANVQFTAIHTSNDEFLRQEGVKNFRDDILGRGELIRDDTQAHGNSVANDDAHSLRDMEPEQLLRMLEGVHLPGIKINSRLTRSEQKRKELSEI